MKFGKWHLKRLQDENDMYKGVKEGLAALGIAISPIAASATPHPAETQNKKIIQEAQESSISEFGSEPIDRFLWNIKQVESSGGKNTNHKKITYGMHKGQKAVGNWGLMPKTVNEMLNRMKKDGTSNPSLEQAIGMNSNELDRHFKDNPKHELAIARYMGRFVMERQGNDQNRAAYAWLSGHNKSYAPLPEHHVKNHYYVKRYQNYDKENPYQELYEASKTGFNHIVHTTLKSEPNKLGVQVSKWLKYRNEKRRNDETSYFNGAIDRGRKREDILDNPPKTLEELIELEIRDRDA